MLQSVEHLLSVCKFLELYNQKRSLYRKYYNDRNTQDDIKPFDHT